MITALKSTISFRICLLKCIVRLEWSASFFIMIPQWAVEIPLTLSAHDIDRYPSCDLCIHRKDGRHVYEYLEMILCLYHVTCIYEDNPAMKTLDDRETLWVGRYPSIIPFQNHAGFCIEIQRIECEHGREIMYLAACNKLAQYNNLRFVIRILFPWNQAQHNRNLELNEFILNEHAAWDRAGFNICICRLKALNLKVFSDFPSN